MKYPAWKQPAQVVRLREPPRLFLRAWFDAFARRFPFLGLAGAIFVSNFAGSFFNFYYNTKLIVERDLNAQQQAVFWNQAAPLYNIVYPLCIGLLCYLIWPTIRCLRLLRHGESVEPAFLQLCQRRVVNLPIVQLIVNPIGWAPGAVFFPWMIAQCSDADVNGPIWRQFFISFGISALFTTVQTFFVLQAYLTAYLYPDFFKNTRPEDVPGVITIPFYTRLVMLWSARRA